MANCASSLFGLPTARKNAIRPCGTGCVILIILNIRLVLLLLINVNVKGGLDLQAAERFQRIQCDWSGIEWGIMSWRSAFSRSTPARRVFQR